MTPATRFNLINAVLFQLGWFVCVLFGNFWAALFTGLTLLGHFAYSNRRREDLIALLLAICIGLLHDSILLGLGQIEFKDSVFISPLWVICVWALLGINLTHSLRWVYERPLIGGALGALCGPISYMAGAELSSAEWGRPLPEVIPVMVTMWLFVLPVHRLASRIILQRCVAYV